MDGRVPRQQDKRLTDLVPTEQSMGCWDCAWMQWGYLNSKPTQITKSKEGRQDQAVSTDQAFSRGRSLCRDLWCDRCGCLFSWETHWGINPEKMGHEVLADTGTERGSLPTLHHFRLNPSPWEVLGVLTYCRCAINVVLTTGLWS